jgi:hypothetical protein
MTSEFTVSEKKTNKCWAYESDEDGRDVRHLILPSAPGNFHLDWMLIHAHREMILQIRVLHLLRVLGPVQPTTETLTLHMR